MDEIHQKSQKYSKMPYQQTEESESERREYSFIASVHQFSDESIHRPGVKAPFDHLLEYPLYNDEEEIPVYVYANGINNESKGYVSLRLRVKFHYLLPLNEYLEFSCIVSVLDSFGNKRFLRSFTFPYGPEWRTNLGSQTFDINRYIKRETLLSETPDLLPKDCLYLQIDSALKTITSDNMFLVNNAIIDSFTTEKRGNEKECRLSLDSAVGRRLKEVSTYFQRMSESAMKEKRTGVMNFPADEYKPFRLICAIVLGSESISLDSIHDICLMYILADKYDIPFAIEICRRLMTSFLRVKDDETIVEHVAESIPEMWELAETFNDVRLKEIVERFLKYKKDGIEYGNRTQEDNLETEWGVRLVEKPAWMLSFSGENSLFFHLWKDVKKYQDKAEFEFYQ